ncbi:MAG TPA: WG repeat-containing protein [Candidatus Acidoferrales bacterium]
MRRAEAGAYPDKHFQLRLINLTFKPLDGPATSCLFDFERGDVPDCIRQAADGKRLVSRAVLKLLQFDSYGLAPVLSAKEGWMYVNRTGTVVIIGVPRMDNGADSFHDGLVRVVRNKKYGFANRKGQIVVPANYDGAMNFEKGEAKVCSGCESKCVDHDCEYHVFAGGEWFHINTKGIVVAWIKPEN